MKNLSALILLFVISSNLLADDSTMTIVGPGFKYHSIYKTIGPNNIKVLEIDLSNPKNKIETVLAKDVLGTGFEKTSSMAQRKNRSGHLVIGAINGDFFGISAPTNPYTFLTGSMISNSEYTFGRTTSRPLFGITGVNKPLIDNMYLSAQVYA
ncbi:MAG: hypothetical protein N3A61_04340, partial [Ignavibacteria bacterium]|nr:hypothetical protein [Ignavibacteria bacterium]